MNTTPLKLAYAALRRQKKRTVLTMLAVAIGISAVITINAAGAGIQKFVLGQLDAFGADTFYMETRVPTAKRNGEFASVGITVTTMKEKDVDTILKHSNVVAAYGQVTGQEAVSYQGQIKKIMLQGKGYSAPEVEVIDLESGRFYTKEEEDSLANVVVLGSKTKKDLFGESDAVDKIIYITGKPFRVIGVLVARGSAFFFDMDNIITIPTKTIQKRLLGIDYYQAIVGKFKDGTKSQATAADLRDEIRENHDITNPDKDDFVVNTTADTQETLTTVTNGLTLLLIALVCISLLVGGVGIMNIMYVSVAERTFEIGLRKALGAKRKDILWQFLAEAIMITVGGGVVGIIVGSLLALLIYIAAISAGFKWVYSISFVSVLLAIGFSGGIGLLFGIYPAKKAAALSPIDALRKE